MLVADELDLRGGFCPTVVVIASTGAIPATATKVLVNNGATAITLTLPAHVAGKGRHISISRRNGSTGAVTLQGASGQIQALAGTLGATTTLGVHSAAGAGVNQNFYSDGTNWYR